MVGSGVVLMSAGPLCAGPALLGASGAVVDPTIEDSGSGSGSGALLLTGALFLLFCGSVWAIRRWRLLRLPPLSAEDRKSDWPLLLVAGLAVLLAQPVGAAVFASFASMGPEARAGLPGVALAAAGGYAGAAAAMIAGAIVVRGLFGLSQAIPRRTDLVRGLIGIVLAAPLVLLVGQIALAVATAVARLTGRELPESNAHATLRLLTQEPGQWSVWWWVLVLAVIVGAPVVEEVVYRGLLQSACRAVTRSRWWAVFATSLVFTLMHAGVAEIHALAVLFTLSVAFGVAFERSGRLWVPITMHALFNAGNLAGALAVGQGSG